MNRTLVLWFLLNGVPTMVQDGGTTLLEQTAPVPCKRDADCKASERLQPRSYKYICDVVVGAKSGFCVQGCRTNQDCRSRPNANQAAVCRPICNETDPGKLLKNCAIWDCYEPARMDEPQ